MAARLCHTTAHRLRRIFGTCLDRSRTFGSRSPAILFPVHFDANICRKSGAQNQRRIFGAGEA
jgi:hypothetical protein